MKEIFDILLYTILGVELLTAIAATYYFKKYAKSTLWILLPFFWIVFFIEITAYFMRINDIPNLGLYNISGVVWFSVLFIVYYRIIKRRNYKRIAIASLIAYYIILILNIIFINGFSLISLHHYAFASGNLLLSLVIFLFLRETLNSEQVLYLKDNLSIWMSVGLLLYHVSLIPLQSVFTFLGEITGGKPYVLFIIQLIISIIMYLCFIAGFICSKTTSRKSLN